MMHAPAMRIYGAHKAHIKRAHGTYTVHTMRMEGADQAHTIAHIMHT